MFRRRRRKEHDGGDWIRDVPVVTEGRLREAPTPDATGMDRRAFGEFCGVRGELASYALGWVTGRDERVGRLSVGIGAGNAGGATFHADVFQHDDGCAFHLTDEPFEDVPQGGPDLTREQALEHRDLPFVFMVGDFAMREDRRGRWMEHWVLGTRAICTQEVFEAAEPVLLVVHDDDDSELEWQFIGTTDGSEDNAELLHLWHLVDEDHTLMDVLDLKPGERAERDHAGAEWRRYAG